MDPKYRNVRLELSNSGVFNSNEPIVQISSFGSYPSNGSATIQLIDYSDGGPSRGDWDAIIKNPEAYSWTGSGSYFVIIGFWLDGGYMDWYVSKSKISFNNALTELVLSKDFNFSHRSDPQ